MDPGLSRKRHVTEGRWGRFTVVREFVDEFTSDGYKEIGVGETKPGSEVVEDRFVGELREGQSSGDLLGKKKEILYFEPDPRHRIRTLGS